MIRTTKLWNRRRHLKTAGGHVEDACVVLEAGKGVGVLEDVVDADVWLHEGE